MEKIQLELGPVRPMLPDDTFKFFCSRCGACCHDAKGAIILNSLDFFRIAKYRGQSPEQIVRQYADLTLIADSVMFPVMTARTKETKGAACWFYREGRCSIQEAPKPLTCRLYPMNMQPGDDDEVLYVLVSQRQHHYTGPEIRARDWMADNMSEDDRKIMLWWYKYTPSFGQMMYSLGNRHGAHHLHEKMRSRIIWYMYLHFNITAAFWPQFERNMGFLERELKEAMKGRINLLS